jgi:pyrroline-5-carboxylate reductase
VATFPAHIALLGCGNMAGAMLRGWLNAGADASAFTVIDPYAKDLPDGVRHFDAVADLGGETFPAVMLGVKPQMLADVAETARALMAPNTLVISMLAGIECAALSRLFPDQRPVRIMPNLAAALNASPVGLFSAALTDAERAEITPWFDALGGAVWLPQESDMALFTALGGSGPAYLYRFIDALAVAATRLGMDPATAQATALATVDGAAKLAAAARHESGDSPATLADCVASPGGSTREGMNVLDADDALIRLLEATLAAARDRNIALAKLAD